MGTLAKSKLRGKRLKAYCLFDQIWRGVAERHGWSNNKARSAGYFWLAEQMGIPDSQCNISSFDEAATQVVIDICMAVSRKDEAA
jgi:hypothetical protein